MLTLKEGANAETAWKDTPDDFKAKIIEQAKKDGGLSIRTKDEETSFTKSFETRQQQEVDKAYGRHKTETETIIAEITGLKPNDNEKASDFLKRAVTDKLKDVKALEDKIKLFETKGIDSDGLAKELRTQKENLEKLLAEKTNEFTNKEKEYSGKIFSFQVSSEIDKAFGEFRGTLGVPGMDEKLFSDVLAARMNKFHAENKAASFENGLVWKDAAGTTYTSKTDGKPQSTKERLFAYFEDLVDKGKAQGGSGSGDGKKDDGKPAEWKNIKLPAEVKTKTELWAYLFKDSNGPKMDQNSKEGNEAYENLGKDLKLR
jgi:hypothetical protein